MVGDLGSDVVAGIKGVQNLEPMNKGGTIEVKGLRITMTDARHSSSFDENGIVYLGEPAGFIVGSKTARRSILPATPRSSAT